MGALYVADGRLSEAEAFYRLSVAILEKALGPEHPEIAALLSRLAELYRDQHKYIDAEPVLRRLLAVREKELGPEHPTVARVLDELGLLYVAQGMYAQAEPLYRRSLAVQTQVIGARCRLASGLARITQPLQGQLCVRDSKGGGLWLPTPAHEWLRKKAVACVINGSHLSQPDPGNVGFVCGFHVEEIGDANARALCLADHIGWISTGSDYLFSLQHYPLSGESPQFLCVLSTPGNLLGPVSRAGRAPLPTKPQVVLRLRHALFQAPGCERRP